MAWLYYSLTKTMERCVICQKQTDKCCSLCNKVFYCSPEHQEVHWHMNHKFNCEGRQRSFDSNQDQFKIYAQTVPKSTFQSRSYEEESKVFIQLFENRLAARADVLSKYSTAKENNSPPITLKQLVKESQQLSRLSKKVSEAYRSGLGDYLDEMYGLITNSFIIKVDQLLDRVLEARCYQLSLMARELRETLVLISSQVEPFPEDLGQDFKKTYRNLLWAVIDVSQSAGLDKISERMFANFIKLCEKFEGIWQQIYAYFNMGVWYAGKTYYQKAIKCFSYASDLASKNNIHESSGLFIADATYNIAICKHSLKENIQAMETMHEAYRLRSKCLGKSSLEASEALYMLAKWHLASKKYQSCLQFVMECLRIRKLSPSFSKELQDVHALIVQIYETIKQDRDQNEKRGAPNNTRYYQRLLEGEQSYREEEKDRKESFTKRLLEEERDIVTFKLIVTPELAETLTSQQWSKIGELIDLQDSKMEREEAIRIILESAFSQSLSEEQRIEFIRLNKIK